jgi:integrase
VRARVARELIAAGAVSPIDGLKQAVWPGPELEALYRDEWNPAVKAAGLEHRTPYAMRHTFASLAIAAGIPSFEIARMMGTSVEMLDKTYGHLLRDAASRGRAALDAFDAAFEVESESFGRGVDVGE